MNAQGYNRGSVDYFIVSNDNSKYSTLRKRKMQVDRIEEEGSIS